ncbi:hypothetical protein VTN96DRAFT_1799 [Rasamsonia emersonii]|uniref:F-box domain-containing protein n=1 Tax=Rasamsonia emersonii (strain ATCC 16479 / CBS 393.64 / IMI 116815) TaxID=1408163 RepID=A0A0F4YLB8_RASE3|nr:hypothetical protein T310_7023 [Rasamsonia emersonii CBS 393.64]KKA19029.1 hypothetical protein T310_7023 [Rasamsonia emersonii CBS 393.64]
MAATLPPELIQSILLSTDPDTFYTARQTCRSWRSAASSAYMLREALKRTPTALPGPSLNIISDKEWNDLFMHVAHLNLIGKRDRVAKKMLRRKRPSNWSYSTVSGVSSDGTRLVSLSGPRASIYNVSKTRDMELDCSQCLYSLWTLTNRAMVDNTTRGMTMGQHGANKYRIAVSTHGALVAIALCRTIQIYDLSSMDTSPVEHTLEENEPLTSVEFVENDSLLRVCTVKNPNNPNSETRVRYLGQPLPSWGSLSPARLETGTGTNLEYWKENIHIVYLDSAALDRSFRDDNKTHFQEMRLLPRSSSNVPGRFFAAAIQNTDEDRYCIGFVPDSDRTQVRIWRQLPSRRDRQSDRWSHHFRGCSTSSSDDDGNEEVVVVEQNRQMARERWAAINMPALTSKHYHLAVSNDGRLLVVYERDAGHSSAQSRRGALYVFSLGCCKPNNPHFSMPWESRAEDANPNPHTESVVDNDNDAVSPLQIQPWSFLLDIVDEDIDVLRVEHVERGSRTGTTYKYKITAENVHSITEWEL